VHLVSTFEVLTENIVSSAVLHGITSQEKNSYASFVGYDYSPGKAMMTGERINHRTMLGFKFQLLPRIKAVLTL